jgi:hypothetical protein
MIRPLITIIRLAITWGGHPSPLKKIWSRDLRREVGSTRNDEGHIDRGESRILR